ncbi:soluble lamin-associated protein of 75 kDa-like isoform X1 [Carcharodon carcharias]|uniref:soluble lamin-associated protein of 75 kDa-like isoform X1 n=1 Tax=Carcharodon carcharias TaxID=13397 RepID=UPI001B7D99F9|nr:soluble lamin-associated protein of 75 kDa-like isoform X1 [Carcharodon carcharias]XP_041042783.1 soluble lamin-associated protein of 75 kDa-like isoform X1 [Carcharodon carcharias]
MAFPVDLLAELEHEDIEHSAEEYMSNLLYADPEKLEYFTLPNRRKIPVSLSSIAFVPLYGGDTTYKVLALFAPENQFTAVALYLVDRWWAIDDIIKTAESSRQGPLQVTSLGERIVLYVLNRIIYRAQEMSGDELPFLCHGVTEYAKILWKSGKAIGFYSIKIAGSKCDTFLTQCYQLPILDTIFVRKKHRGKGYGLQMLEDFVDCFTEDTLGLKYPLSASMYGVCRKYLNNYPDDHSLLWEVEGVGHPFQRVRIADRLLTQISPVKGMDVSHADEHGPVRGESSSLNLTESETGKQLFNKVERQPNISELSTELHARQELPGASSVLSEELTRPPVAKRGRSSQSKRSKPGKCHVDSERKHLNDKEKAIVPAVPKDQLNSSEARRDGSDNAPQTIGNQETCAFPEGPTEVTASDVVLGHTDLLEQDVEDKESSSETIPEPVNCEMTDQVVQDSTKAAQVIPDDQVKAVEVIPEDPASAEEEILKDSTEAEKEILKDSTKAEEEISKDLIKAEEGIPEDSTKAEEEIPEDSANTEEAIPKDSTKVDEIPEDTTKADEIPEDSDKAEGGTPHQSTKTEDEDTPDLTKSEKEIAQDAMRDKEVIIQDSTEVDEEVNESMNGAPADQLENEPEGPKSVEELKGHSEGNMMKKDAELEEENAEEVLTPNEGEESEPLQGPAVNSSPSNHHAPVPNKAALAESRELPDVQANAKPSDNGHVSVNEEVSQHSALEGEGISDDFSKTASAQHESEPGESNAPIDLSLGPLLVIELEDVSLKQVSTVQLSGDENKESDDLKDQPSPAVVEKAADSSSEEMEMEVPVVDRRNLRRKVKGNKGPPKKRSKVSKRRKVHTCEETVL